jgi:hypothetical protein
VAVKWSSQRVTDVADGYSFNSVLEKKKMFHFKVIFLQYVGRASSIRGPLGAKVARACDRPAQ